MYFGSLHENAHIWIYGFDRTMTEQERITVSQELQQFTSQWKSHGKKINGEYLILYDRFVILAVSHQDFVSGCSIDSSVRIFKKIQNDLDLNGLDVNLVFYRKNGGILSANRTEFQKALDVRELGPDTVVYDTTIQTVGDLRAGKFERKLAESWHAGVFSLSA